MKMYGEYMGKEEHYVLTHEDFHDDNLVVFFSALKKKYCGHKHAKKDGSAALGDYFQFKITPAIPNMYQHKHLYQITMYVLKGWVVELRVTPQFIKGGIEWPAKTIIAILGIK